MLIFFIVWIIRSVNDIPLRADIFSYYKVFERLSVIAFKRSLKFRAKENLNKFIWFLQRPNLKLVTKSKSCFKYSSQTSNKNLVIQVLFGTLCPNGPSCYTKFIEGLVVGSWWFLKFFLYVPHYTSQHLFSFGYYLSNARIWPADPIASRRILQSFVNNLISRLRECIWQ